MIISILYFLICLLRSKFLYHVPKTRKSAPNVALRVVRSWYKKRYKIFVPEIHENSAIIIWRQMKIFICLLS